MAFFHASSFTTCITDVINVSGHRLSTAEIESALIVHPGVAEAAVIGATDDLTGQAVHSFVTLKPLVSSHVHVDVTEVFCRLAASLNMTGMTRRALIRNSCSRFVKSSVPSRRPRRCTSSPIFPRRARARLCAVLCARSLQARVTN